MSNNVSSIDVMDSFQNNDEKPLNKLTYRIRNCGIIQDVPALSKYWVEKRYYLRYEIPKINNEDGTTIIGAKDEWLELVDHMIKDLKWLLSLPHFKFWSNVVFEPSMLIMLVSVLQESPPFYALDDFPDQIDMREALNTVQRLVLLTFLRLVTTNETSKDYQDPVYHGNILYDNYIFTVAIIWDLCQLYGRENGNTVEMIVKNLFDLQPLYEDDLKKSLPFLSRVFRGIEQRFEDCPVYLLGETVPLSERGGANGEITLSILEDHVLHILDVSSTLAIFLDIYPDGGKIFHDIELMNRITSIYENTLPKMYEKLEQLAYNNETMEKYFQIVHRLDVARVDLLKLYRSIIFSSINNILENKNRITEIEVKESVDRYLGLLLDALSVKEFINDYHRVYPIDMDLDILAHVCPEVDSMKCDFILQSLYASLNDSNKTTSRKNFTEQSNQSHEITSENNHNFENIPGPSTSSGTLTNDFQIDDGGSNNVKTGVELASLITEVKDILPHLGEGYIEKCLKHYNNDSTSVINAVLEDSLPSDIKELDPTLPHIPPDPMEASVAVDVATGMERLNVFDNDEFDVMTRDNIDTSKIHKGKRKGKHKNLNDLLNDKSYKEGLSSVYSKYSLIADDYEDEYDDTYESQDVGLSARDELTEIDARPFTVPRVLQTQSKYKAASEDDEDDEHDDIIAQTSSSNNERMQFTQDPAILRARAEERRQFKRDNHQTRKSAPTQEKDVTGKPKGQGQEKQVVVNRDNKNTHKSSRGNHNRRRGAQWKRTQGMVPS